MARHTKADLEERIRNLEDALDKLLASHRDCTSGYGFNAEWAKRVEQYADNIRHNIHPKREC